MLLQGASSDGSVVELLNRIPRFKGSIPPCACTGSIVNAFNGYV